MRHSSNEKLLLILVGGIGLGCGFIGLVPQFGTAIFWILVIIAIIAVVIKCTK